MDSQLLYLQEVLADKRADLEAAVSEVPPGGFAVRPGDDRWSVAQVLEHLIVVEKSVTRLLESMLPKAEPRTASTPLPTSFMDDIDLQLILDRTRKLNREANAKITGDFSREQALAGLQESREKLLEAVQKGNGLVLEALTFEHPFFGPLNMYQWIAFVAFHEGRHTAQIREI